MKFLIYISFLMIGYLHASETIPIKKHGEIWVMVVDTGISVHPRLKGLVQYDESFDYKDDHGHGTHVTGILALGNHMVTPTGIVEDRLCSRVKIFSCRYYDPYADLANVTKTVNCIDKATKWKMDYINYSGGGIASFLQEYKSIKKFSDQGGIFVTVTGNEGVPLASHPYYPASYKFGLKELPPISSMIIVEAIDKNAKIWTHSNTSDVAKRELGVDVFSTLPVGQYGYMSGTSQAAPMFLHSILKQKCLETDSFQIGSK